MMEDDNMGNQSSSDSDQEAETPNNPRFAKDAKPQDSVGDSPIPVSTSAADDSAPENKDSSMDGAQGEQERTNESSSSSNPLSGPASTGNVTNPPSGPAVPGNVKNPPSGPASSGDNPDPDSSGVGRKPLSGPASSGNNGIPPDKSALSKPPLNVPKEHVSTEKKKSSLSEKEEDDPSQFGKGKQKGGKDGSRHGQKGHGRRNDKGRGKADQRITKTIPRRGQSHEERLYQETPSEDEAKLMKNFLYEISAYARNDWNLTSRMFPEFLRPTSLFLNAFSAQDPAYLPDRMVNCIFDSALRGRSLATPIDARIVKELIHDVAFFYSLYGMVPNKMDTEEEKLQEFEQWKNNFKEERRMFAGKVLTPYSSFGKKLHELIKSYLLPTQFKISHQELERVCTEVIREMFSLKDSATAFVPTLENIPPIAITLLNAKVLKIRAIFPKPVMPDHNDGYCAKDVEWLEASIVSAELRSQEREKKEEKRHETLAWSLQEELDKWKHDYNELKDRQDGGKAVKDSMLVKSITDHLLCHSNEETPALSLQEKKTLALPLQKNKTISLSLSPHKTDAISLELSSLLLKEPTSLSLERPLSLEISLALRIEEETKMKQFVSCYEDGTVLIDDKEKCFTKPVFPQGENWTCAQVKEFGHKLVGVTLGPCVYGKHALKHKLLGAGDQENPTEIDLKLKELTAQVEKLEGLSTAQAKRLKQLEDEKQES
jgi:hypothetical protein